MSASEIVMIVVGAIETEDMETTALFLSDDFVLSGLVSRALSKSEWLSVLRETRSAFPDYSLNVINVRDANSVVRITTQFGGTHTGDLDLSIIDLPSVPATGKAVLLPIEYLDFTVKGDDITGVNLVAATSGGLWGMLHQLGVSSPNSDQA